MSCQSVQELLLAHKEQALPEHEAARVGAHLDSCSRCQALQGQLSECLKTIDTSPITPPEAILQRLKERTREIKMKTTMNSSGSKAVTPAHLPTQSVSVAVTMACTYCKDTMNESQSVHCARCLARYHEDCFQELGTCGILGCESQSLLRPEPVHALAKKQTTHTKQPSSTLGQRSGASSHSHSRRRSFRALVAALSFGVVAGLGTAMYQRYEVARRVAMKQEMDAVEKARAEKEAARRARLAPVGEKQRWHQLLGLDIQTIPGKPGVYIRSLDFDGPFRNYWKRGNNLIKARIVSLNHSQTIQTVDDFREACATLKPSTLHNFQIWIPSAVTRTYGQVKTGSLKQGRLGATLGPKLHITSLEIIGAANDAGLKLQDQILSVAGQRPRSASHINEILKGQRVGDSVELEVLRQKRRRTFQVTLTQ